MSTRNVSLRRAVPVTLGLLVGALLLAAAASEGRATPRYAGVPALLPGAALAAAADTFKEPLVVRSDPRTGILDARILVDTATLPVPTSTGIQNWNLRSYQFLGANTNPNPSPPAFPGPTYRMRLGDLVRINLINGLPANSYPNTACQPYPAVSTLSPPADTFQGCFHGPNFTNIHYHGTHVTPDSTSTTIGDDVLLVVAPGDSLQYSFRIPQNQSPGTHWYHPHKHGSVALQVTNGMSGAFIVEGGGLDSLTAAEGFREHLIAFQEIDPNVNLIDNSVGRVRLVNGQANPTIVMRPGEVQRWRFVNENVSKTATFALIFAGSSAPSLYDIARDGVSYAPANYNTVPDLNLIMAPGNRLDVFVQAPMTTGTSVLSVQQVETGQPSRKRGTSDLTRGAVQATAAATPLLTVQVSGTPSNDQLPQTLPNTPFDIDLPTQPGSWPVIVFTDDTVTVAGSTAKTQLNPARFYLGTLQNPAQQFNDTIVYIPTDSAGTQMPMVLGQTQTWKIENHSQLGINHPFHIHINPFQVDSVYAPSATDSYAPLYAQLNAAAAAGHPIWLDVLPLPQGIVNTQGVVVTPGYVYITQRYEDFGSCTDCGPPTGEFVMHCHILGHEERGMMQVIEIVPAGGGSATAPRSRPQGHAGH